MNNLAKWKMRLIEWLAGDEPILLNWFFSTHGLKDGYSVISYPLSAEKLTPKEASLKAILTPVRNVK